MLKKKVLMLLPSLEPRSPINLALSIAFELAEKYNFEIAYFNETEHKVDVNNIPVFKLSLFSDGKVLRKFDIVHAHLFRPNIFVAINSKYINKSITTLHSDIYNDLAMSHNLLVSNLFGSIWKYSLRKHDAVVFLNSNQMEKYKNNSFTSQLIPNGFKKIEVIKKQTISSENKIVIGACCNAVKIKGLDQVIRALKEDSSNRLEFVYVGDGPELKQLQQLTVTNGVENKIKFVGRVDNVMEYLTNFDIYISTSHSEGMPISLIEAASARIPIVSTDIPSIRSIFDDDEVVFYKLNDISDLLDKLFSCHKDRRKYAENAYKKYEEMYMLSHMLDNYDKLYRSVNG
ncbi:glycosyltransferase family 4 protein [Vibrio sp. ECSMB14106]|uniref:glycosyltransferase family 4 protein n=1 Tax=Vibrio sp. ECSMB14106 TaxID=1638949 RepID=UPI000619C26C|nr:glycosyltransferase family 4 protein [Vibrio sp. ECSMB14106]